MTRIIALLSWYDEQPAWLARCVTSLHKLPATHLIALDGAYQLFPDAQPASDPQQALTIEAACRNAGITCHLHTPTEPWAGNEVEKRNRLFELAEQVAQPDDWYFVIDSDEHITSAPDNIPERLARSPFDVGAIELRQPGHLGPVIFPTHPKFFRAIPGLRAVGDHFTYTTPDGRRLWGDQRKHRLEARDDLTNVKVEHLNELRPTDRRTAAHTYYRNRDQAGIEDLPSERYITA